MKDNRYTILKGNCIKIMQSIDDCSVNTCITSPPYFGLRNYNGGTEEIGCEQSPEDYVKKMVEVFREVKRILRPDGTLWLNLGDSYASNGCYINAWMKKDQNKGKKHLHTKNYDRYEDRKAFRGGEYQIKAKDLMGIPWRVAFALQADGWWLRQDIIWHKPNPMPESVEDRCTRAHEYIFMLTKKPHYYYDHEAIKEPAQNSLILDSSNEEFKELLTKNKRSVWKIKTKGYKGAHFAVYPEELITPCVLSSCPKGGIVFDPFVGSGTTCVVALKNDRNFLGCELNSDYIEIASKRIEEECPIGLWEA